MFGEVHVKAQSVGPFVTCVNNYDVLRRNLLRSPDVAALGLRSYEKQRSAAAAYNNALEDVVAGSDYTIFVHQDVYLPPGWLDKLEKNVAHLGARDGSWAVLGCAGITHDGRAAAYVYSNGHGVSGEPFGQPVRVRTLDEIVLVVRHAPGLRFTESHPGFHMYGTDICLRAEQLGLNCYAIDNYCVHNTRRQSGLPVDFYWGYLAIKKHFPDALPVKSTCAEVTDRTSLPFLVRLLRQELARRRGRARPAVERVDDPACLV